MWTLCVYPWTFFVAGVLRGEFEFLLASLIVSCFSLFGLVVVAKHDAKYGCEEGE